MMQQITEGTTNYGGVLHWNAFTDNYTSTAYPAIDVELWIKEHSIPARKKNTNEINTPSYYDSHADLDTGVNAIFEGAPELLAITLSGMLKTPISNNKPTSPYYYPSRVGVYLPMSGGSAITPLVSIHYGEIVMLLISGEINRTAGGAFQRKDPNYFIDGYGNKYTNPVIQSWEASTVGGSPKHQSFSATILLEY